MKQHRNIILGSKSPRRQELLKGLGVNFTIDTKEVEEIYDKDLSPELVPEFLAALKSEPFTTKEQHSDVIITSDTVVIEGGRVLGKPKGFEGAVEMLLSLSGKKHKVITGVCIMMDNVQYTFKSETLVEFDTMSREEIEYYVTNFEPYDKAGSYGIQEWIGHAKIKGIDGCYYNVMGLPLRDLYQKLIELNVIS